MRATPTHPIIAFLWSLFAPVLAFAQEAGGAERGISRSPQFWFWVVVLAVAIAVFSWRSVAMSRRRGGPPTTPRTP